jgi:hypothetical protein
MVDASLLWFRDYTPVDLLGIGPILNQGGSMEINESRPAMCQLFN